MSFAASECGLITLTDTQINQQGASVQLNGEHWVGVQVCVPKNLSSRDVLSSTRYLSVS